MPFDEAVCGVTDAMLVVPNRDCKVVLAENVIVSPTENPLVLDILMLGTSEYAADI
jgi:hypothetical protein